uniref:Putative secreted protein n=1 Tax=Anopheles darlingi TaxID=43151 RepID=A0A2M4DLP3_ANODA
MLSTTCSRYLRWTLLSLFTNHSFGFCLFCLLLPGCTPIFSISMKRSISFRFSTQNESELTELGAQRKRNRKPQHLWSDENEKYFLLKKKLLSLSLLRAVVAAAF